VGFVSLLSDVSVVSVVSVVTVVSRLFSKIAFFSGIAPRNSNEGLFQTADYSRVQDLLASGLDELLFLAIPITDEAMERKELLRLIGTL